MPIYEIALPVGAKNIKPALTIITRSGKDGNVPVAQVFDGDNFVGEALEGHWRTECIPTSLESTALLKSGQLELTGYGTGSPNIQVISDVGIPIMQDGYVDVHVEGHGSAPAANCYLYFYLTGISNPDLGSGPDWGLRCYFQTEMTTGDTHICVAKFVDGAYTVIYAETGVTNNEGTFRIKFRPDDDEIDVYFHDGTGDVAESTDKLTLTSDSDDMFPHSVVYPVYYHFCQNINSHYSYSNGIWASYPDMSISYDLDADDVGKGDVKCYDTMGSATESDWRRVYSEDHSFTGDCVIENGLVRMVIDEASQYGVEFYYWTGSAWSQPLDQIQVYQEEDAQILSYAFLKSIESFNRVESVQLKVRLCSSATESDSVNAELLLTMSRGKRHITAEIVSSLPPQSIRVMFGDSTPLRWSYLGDDKICDQDFPDSPLNTTLTDNFMAIVDDTSTIIGYIATNQKPTEGGAAFYSYLGTYIAIYSIAISDFSNTEVHIGILLNPNVTDYFAEAEDGTTNASPASTADGSASGGYKVVLDALNEYVYHDLVGVTDIPLGRYRLFVRAKDSAQVADDLQMKVYNSSDSSYCNEEHDDVKHDAAATWGFFSVVFDIRARDSGDTIQFHVLKGTAVANDLQIDYFIIVPIGDGGSYVQDIAHNAMREVAVNFCLTDSATYELFSGLGFTGQLAGSVYTDVMAINAIENAASITLSGPFTASTIKTGADNEGIYVGSGDDLRVYHDGTDTYIQNANGQLIVKAIGDDVVLDAVDVFVDISQQFYLRDKDDSNVILMELDTDARTLQFGQAADKLTADLYGDLTISDYLTIDTINHAVSDTDKFLVSDGGEVKYRTGSELASDIGAASVPLALTDLASYVQGSIIIGGGADWEALGAGTLNYVLKMGAAEPAWGQVDYSELAGTQPAPIAHNLIDTTGHPVAGLTPGHFLKALTATTYGFAVHGLGASDVGAYTIAQTDTAIDTDISTHNVANRHIDHSGVSITAGTGLSGGGTIAATRTINCDITQYTNAMAVAAVVAENPLALTNAIKVGGNSIEDSTGAEMIGFDGAGFIDFLGGQGTPSDNDVLAWDSGTSKWVVQAQVGTGGGPGTGTQWTLPVWNTTTTLGDSMITQNSGGTLATVGGALTVSGALKAGGDGFDVDATGNITDITVAAATVDTDKFIVQDGSQLKYRSGAQVRSDIGASATGHTHTHVSTTGRTANDHHAQSHNVASHSDVTISGAQLEDATGYGSANAAWINCPFEGVTYGAMNSGGQILNSGDDDMWVTFSVPLPTVKGTLKLYISGTRVKIDASSGSFDRVDNTYIRGHPATGGITNMDIDPTDKNSAGTWEDTSMGAIDCSVRAAIKILLGCHNTVASALQISHVLVRHYYA